MPNESYTEYLTSLFDKWRDSQAAARENLINSKIRSKKYYDRKFNIHKFKLGDGVYLLKEPNKEKRGDQYTGPYKIIKLLKNNNVKIAISNYKTRTAHEDKLKPSPHQALTTDNPHSEEEEYNTDTRTENRTVSREPPYDEDLNIHRRVNSNSDCSHPRSNRLRLWRPRT